MTTNMQVAAQALYGSSTSVPKQKSFAVSFIERSTICGHTEWPLQNSHEQQHIPYSRAYFCDNCGDIWARLLVHDNPEAWHLIYRKCRRHTHVLSSIAGGTFFDPQLQENFDIPKHILAEDFLFLMSLYDKLADSYIS